MPSMGHWFPFPFFFDVIYIKLLEKKITVLKVSPHTSFQRELV